MLAAMFWSAFAASSLLIGALLTLWIKPSQRLIGLIMAFGAGTLIAAVAYDLVEDAAAAGSEAAVGVGLALGALTFYVGDWWVDRAGGETRKKSNGEQADGDSLGIFIGTLLDGVPESFIIGLSFAAGVGINVSFLAAVFISNLPEAMGATTGLSAAGWTKRRIAAIWTAVILAATAAAGLGFVLASASTLEGALAKAFAAGALLTMLADTMIPEAFEYGGKLVGLLTVLGFAVALSLG